MNMIEAVKSVLTQYVGFSGRARRSEYWFWILATIIVGIIVAIIEAVMGIGTDASGPISNILNLAIFLPGLAVTFRRLHDTGRSGWWIGGFYLAIIVFGLIIGLSFAGLYGAGGDSSFGAGIGTMAIIGVLGVLIYSIVIIVFMCQDSQAGPNEYGPNPKNEGNYDVFE